MSEARKSTFAKAGIDNATANRVKKSCDMRKDKRASIFVTKRRMLSVIGDTPSSIPSVIAEPVNDEEVTNIVNSIVHVQDLKKSLAGLRALRVYLCSHFEDEGGGPAGYINQILAVHSDHSCRCIDVITQYLAYYKSEEVQSDAAWCLTNLSASCFSNEQLALFLPAIPICLQIISFSNSSSTQVLKEQCCWAIGNVVSATVEDGQMAPSSGAATNVKSVVLSNGALHVIVEYLYYTMAELKQLQSQPLKSGTGVSAVLSVGRRLQTVLWVLCNLIRTNVREEPADNTGVVTGELLVQTVGSFMNAVEVGSDAQRMNSAGDTGVHRYFRGVFELLSLPFSAAVSVTGGITDDEKTQASNCFFQVVQEVSWVAVYLSTKNADFVAEIALRCGLSKVQ
jgi:hypothetical protein